MALKRILDSIDDLDPAIQAEYEEKDGKFHLLIEGQTKTDADVTRLTGSLTKERNDHKATKQKLAAFGDLDPAETRTQLDRIAELEELAEGKVDETKINKLVETRIKSRLAPVERERDTARTELAAAQSRVDELLGTERTRTLQEAVRAAAKKAGVKDVAMDDAVMLGERNLVVNDDGDVVVADSAKGFTAGVAPDVWLTELRDKKPHWWGETTGGGARGSGGGAGSVNPFIKGDSWNLTEQGRITRENPGRAEQLRKAAEAANARKK